MEIYEYESIRDLLIEIRNRLPEPEPALPFQDLDAVLAYHRAKIEEAMDARKKLDAEFQRL